ncbi:cupin (plasmid) [Rhizobium sullae]|uniref:Cupin n=1 Tax=Rhizobium sullae TaxID=50338 RepID=A0A2N0D9Q9_RHISU|nr:cupin [Rhizobium sullae]PKA42845.1 cupin [Rhizobium sullae]UWU18242.1 cupin [Rhizobium sullae]
MEPEAIRLEPSEFVPNNPAFPLLFYRGVLKDGNLAEGFEGLFRRNGWGNMWRNGVYPFHHYHSKTHEALGFAAGSATLMLGGPTGPKIEVHAGDAAILPAGTGHCRLSASSDFLVIGAYPPGSDYDLCREAATPEQLRRIRDLSAPRTDPVTGGNGGLIALWR